MEKLIKLLEEIEKKNKLLEDQVAEALLEEAKKTSADSKEWNQLMDWIMSAERSVWIKKVYDNVEWGIVDESR